MVIYKYGTDFVTFATETRKIGVGSAPKLGSKARWKKMNNEIELKPCPFCGAKVGYYQGFMLTGIHCAKCGAVVSFVGSEKKDKAAQAWNRRATNDDKL